MGTSSQDIQTRQILADKLGFTDHYWYPLTGEDKPDNAEFFNAQIFLNSFGLDKLIETIKGFGDQTINSILETHVDSKISAVDLEPYCGEEVIYCNDNVDWAIYFSHENTVTFVGQKLLDTLKKDWRDFDKYKGRWDINAA